MKLKIMSIIKLKKINKKTKTNQLRNLHSHLNSKSRKEAKMLEFNLRNRGLDQEAGRGAEAGQDQEVSPGLVQDQHHQRQNP